jgi:hypothetical protein
MIPVTLSIDVTAGFIARINTTPLLFEHTCGGATYNIDVVLP